MSEPLLVSFESNYVQGPDELAGDPMSAGALACAAIDGYPMGEDPQGTVVCDVWLTKSREFIVDWHHNGYRTDPSVLELIRDVQAQLLEAYPA